jgi:two-component system cell cycle sensor histidine kinase/response regulator CckA
MPLSDPADEPSGPLARLYHHLAGLRFRILFLGLLGVLPAVYFVALGAVEQRRAEERQSRGEAYRLARLICENERRSIEGARQLLSTLAQLPQLQSCTHHECDETFHRIVSSNSTYLNIGYTDSTGMLECSALPVATPLSLADRAWFQECFRERSFALGTYQIGRVTGRPSINAAEPVLTPDGRLRGVVFVALGLHSFLEPAERAPLPPGGSLTVVDRGGTILARHPSDWLWAGTAPRDEAAIESTLAVRNGTFEASGVDGLARFYACAPLLKTSAGEGGYVCVGIAKGPALAAAEAAFRKSLLGLGIAVLIAFLGSWLLGSLFVVRPARALVRAFRRLAAGDLRARSEVPRGSGEIHHLALAFDGMAEVLERRQDEAERARAALRESERRFRLFMDMSPLIAFIKDAEGRLIYANANAVRAIGRPVREILGCTNEEIYPAEVAEVVSRNDARMLASQQPMESTEVLPAPGGSPVPHMVFRFPISQPDGRTLLGGVAVDTSARQRLEEQFRQAQKLEAVGRLAGGVAHDFNNILTAIMGYSQLLARRLPADGAPGREAAEILKAAERAAGLTRQLLAFSRRDVSQPRPVELNGLVSGMGKMLRRLIGEDVDLVVSSGAGLRPIQADPGQIEQVLMNLVVNARDAMPDGGRITIATRNVAVDEERARGLGDLPPGAYVALVVSDTGAGMDAETRAHIFEPFFTTKGPEKGTGLGLSTVYGIVQQSGGTIDVESAPGAGTTFTLYFPARTGQAPLPDAPERDDAIPTGRETVLVLEDQEAVAAVMRETLEMVGYTVLEARSGREALALLERRKQPVHLVVSDVVLPETQGPEIARRILERCPGARILFVSGYTARPLPGPDLMGAATGFLSKPFTPSALARKIRELLDAPETEAA